MSTAHGSWVPRSRRGWRFAAPYLLLIVIVGVYLAYRFAFRPANSEFLGLYLLILSVPWSMLASSLTGNAWAIWLAVVGGMLLNGILLYRLGAAGERRR